MASAAGRVAAERIQIYERLAEDVSADQLEAFFKLFAISLKDKKKKVALSEAICTYSSAGRISSTLSCPSHVACVGVKPELIEASITCMLQVFNELANSSDIVFQKASKKASRRLSMKSTNTVPDPLPPSMWAHTRLRDRIHKNYKEVTRVIAPALLASNGGASNGRKSGEAHDDHQKNVARMQSLMHA